MPFLIAFITLFLFLFFPALRKHKDRKLFNQMFFAHRGLHNNEIPENSISAFINAVENGYGIELDIRLTADGEIIVFHDETIERMCGGEGNICEMTLSEIRELRLNNTDERIPTFKEALSVIDGRVPLMVEFKCNDLNCKELCEKANEMLNRFNGLYCIESFNPMIVYWYKKNRKDIFRGQLAMNTKGKDLITKLSSTFIFNFLARPDFVSYEEKFDYNFFFKIQKILGAFPVGWTFKSEKDLKTKRKTFKIFIFEKFKP